MQLFRQTGKDGSRHATVPPQSTDTSHYISNCFYSGRTTCRSRQPATI